MADALSSWFREEDRVQRTWDESIGYMLGYPPVSTLVYDPTPGPEWMPILSVYSDDGLEFCWHDATSLHVFITRAALAARDFSALRADVG